MTIAAQFAGTPSYSDFPFKNSGGTTIAAGSPVKVDAANAISASNVAAGVGVVAATADGDVCVGFAIESAAAGTVLRVRCCGPIAVTKADGAITAGTFVMSSATAGKVKTQAAGSASVGVALTTAADGEDLLVLVGAAQNA